MNDETRAVDALECFELDGTKQWALIRGNPDAPVLLLIQQGPGLPIIQEAPALERALELEERFRVVYWDQRGTGRSFTPGTRHGETIDDIAGDTRQLVRALCERLGVARVHVVGFSLGGTLGLLAATQDPTHFASLVCVGPDVNFPEAERFAYAFALEQAERRGNRRALRALRAAGEPPHRDAKAFMTRVRWVSNFGGVHAKKSFWGLLGGTLGALWESPHYDPWQVLGALRGIDATQAAVLPKLGDFDLLGRELHVRVPVEIFQGRLDAAAPPALSRALAERLNVPLVEFEHSAHMPHHEEPARFRAMLLRFIDHVEGRERGAVPEVAAE